MVSYVDGGLVDSNIGSKACSQCACEETRVSDPLLGVRRLYSCVSEVEINRLKAFLAQAVVLFGRGEGDLLARFIRSTWNTKSPIHNNGKTVMSTLGSSTLAYRLWYI